MDLITRQDFEAALARRDILGQAKGVNMQRTKVNANAAFQVLVQDL